MSARTIREHVEIVDGARLANKRQYYSVSRWNPDSGERIGRTRCATLRAAYRVVTEIEADGDRADIAIREAVRQ